MTVEDTPGYLLLALLLASNHTHICVRRDPNKSPHGQKPAGVWTKDRTVIGVVAWLNPGRTLLWAEATPRRATLNRATVKRRQLSGRQLTGATINRSDR